MDLVRWKSVYKNGLVSFCEGSVIMLTIIWRIAHHTREQQCLDFLQAQSAHMQLEENRIMAVDDLFLLTFDIEEWGTYNVKASANFPWLYVETTVQSGTSNNDQHNILPSRKYYGLLKNTPSLLARDICLGICYINLISIHIKHSLRRDSETSEISWL